jgi:hypothetical protein
MRIAFPVVLALSAVLAACAPQAATEPHSQLPSADHRVASVTIETGPCFGACPVYVMSVNEDGSGTFEGRRFTAVSGAREFRVTPEQYRAFVAHLEPVHPESGVIRYDAPPRCARMATDLPSTDVKWRTGDGRQQELYFYHGCDMEKNRAISERLSKAADLLPVREFIRAGE